ncbi:hypothetical protein HK097_003045 [Rhizophlyctis rosea]|uniref:aspartyl aminopeptidase n=1 Tax=Rhizophlyctis rosea TaxID=64517 RepID=A0AAD5SMD1_9FUNG|nr:hypothetical protein HK097_003045 [Rhizophlyctis rosea]
MNTHASYSSPGIVTQPSSTFAFVSRIVPLLTLGSVKWIKVVDVVDLESSDPSDTLVLDDTYWPEARNVGHEGWVEWKTWEKIEDMSKIGEGFRKEEGEKWADFQVNQTVGLGGPAGGVTAWGELDSVLSVAKRAGLLSNFIREVETGPKGPKQHHNWYNLDKPPTPPKLRYSKNSEGTEARRGELARTARSEGYEEINERDSWQDLVTPGGRYFFTRNKSSIVAFAVGAKYKSGNGFSILGAHTDSPCFKVKPRSKKEKFGYVQVGVETYGGGIWATWFDRDLGLAGRVITKRSDGKLDHQLVHIKRPILRIPTLAIHLDRTINEAFKFNNETQLLPILSLVTKTLNSTGNGKEEPAATGVEARHHPLLLRLLAEELHTEVSEIGDFELCLYDTQPSTIGGAQNEFIYSARCDNLIMSYCSLSALINSTAGTSLKSDPNIRLITLFDNEEIGSVSAYGADSNLLEITVRRLSSLGAPATPVDESFAKAMSRSLLISADMAHAQHPNYPDKHEDNHRPAMNAGLVIKQNANQRYATTAVTMAVLRECVDVFNKGVTDGVTTVKLQEFVVRNDSPCGSTIGPMLSAKMGLRTIDVGNPQLSMHSAREMAGTEDVENAINIFQTFFEHFPDIDARLNID